MERKHTFLINEQNPMSRIERTFRAYLRDLNLKEKDLLNKKILDVGAGDCNFAKYAKDNNINSDIYSLDPDEKVLKNEKGIVGSAEHIPFPDEEFELVVSLAAVPRYLSGAPSNIKEQTHQCFSELYRVCKQGGEIRLGRVLMKKNNAPCLALYEGIKESLSELKDKFNATIETFTTHPDSIKENLILSETVTIIIKKI